MVPLYEHKERQLTGGLASQYMYNLSAVMLIKAQRIKRALTCQANPNVGFREYIMQCNLLMKKARGTSVYKLVLVVRYSF